MCCLKLCIVKEITKLKGGTEALGSAPCLLATLVVSPPIPAESILGAQTEDLKRSLIDLR